MSEYEKARYTPAPVGEPVAWRYRYVGPSLQAPGPWRVREEPAVDEELQPAFYEFVPLYAHPPATSPEPLQARVQPWMMACFGPEISADRTERNHRFLEEALELVQSCGCTASEAHQLIDYVYGRDVGEPSQEAGGVMITLAALCLANGLDMHECGETELARIWTKVEKIRAKQAAKPKNSPLPETPATSAEREEAKRLVEKFEATPWNSADEQRKIMKEFEEFVYRIVGGA